MGMGVGKVRVGRRAKGRPSQIFMKQPVMASFSPPIHNTQPCKDSNRVSEDGEQVSLYLCSYLSSTAHARISLSRPCRLRTHVVV